MGNRPCSTSLMLLTSAKIIINIEYTMGKDAGFYMVIRKQVIPFALKI